MQHTNETTLYSQRNLKRRARSRHARRRQNRISRRRGRAALIAQRRRRRRLLLLRPITARVRSSTTLPRSMHDEHARAEVLARLIGQPNERVQARRRLARDARDD